MAASGSCSSGVGYAVSMMLLYDVLPRAAARVIHALYPNVPNKDGDQDRICDVTKEMSIISASSHRDGRSSLAVPVSAVHSRTARSVVSYWLARC